MISLVGSNAMELQAGFNREAQRNALLASAGRGSQDGMRLGALPVTTSSGSNIARKLTQHPHGRFDDDMGLGITDSSMGVHIGFSAPMWRYGSSA